MGALKIERVPHGDIPFLGMAQSIRHELFLQQYPGPNAINTPHQCLASPTLLVWRIGEAILIIQAPTHHAAAMGYKSIQG
jgi:hypothetical protein